MTDRPRPLTKAVFPVAGLGTRFLPATKVQPKEMLPLVDKPAIQYGWRRRSPRGSTEIILVTGRRQARHRGPLRRRLRAGVLPGRAGQARGAGPGPDDLRAGDGVLRAAEGAARARSRHPVRAPAGGRRALRRVPGRRHHRVPRAVHAAAPRRLRAPRRPGAGRHAGAARGDRPLRGHRRARPLGGNVFEVHDLVEKPAAGRGARPTSPSSAATC